MSDDQARLHFRVIEQKIAALQGKDMQAWQELDAALEDLQVIYEELQTSLETAEIVRENFLQQTQQLTERCHYYQNLFLSLPIAYLVTDTDGVILEANQAIAQLLNVPQGYLAERPLILYVAESDRPAFRTQLNHLAQGRGIPVWQVNFCPRHGKPLTVELHVNTVRGNSGLIEQLQIGIHPLSQTQQQDTLPPQLNLEILETIAQLAQRTSRLRREN